MSASREKLRRLLQGAIDRGIEVRGPTVDELVEYFTAPCLLQLIRLHSYDVWLSDNGQRIEYGDSIPVWLANAIALYGAEILEHMQADFLGTWRRGGGDGGDSGHAI
jgi:hypothetical protein